MPKAAATSRPLVPVAAARTLLLRGHALLDDPSGPATAASVRRLIRTLGFVQLDSINAVERAHHHVLWTRLHAYRPELLDQLQRKGHVFEHWTHDASYIPAEVFPHWRHRFARVDASEWIDWIKRRLGKDGQLVLDQVLTRIRDHGPVKASDFEHDGAPKSGQWWDWKPAKAALEFWWRAGVLSVPRRESFQKVYDLTERVLPHVHQEPASTREALVDWACSTALDRLGVATPRELAAFYRAITIQEATAWMSCAFRSGQAVPVRLEVPDAKPRPGAAHPQWARRARSAPDGPAAIRLLSPFDPIIRDRDRCKRLFDFDFRFEAFTPAPKRKYAYFALPLLETGEGDARLVGRLDPSLDRQKGLLTVRRVWWEPGITPTKARRRALEAGIDQFARFNKAERWTIQDADERGPGQNRVFSVSAGNTAAPRTLSGVAAGVSRRKPTRPNPD